MNISLRFIYLTPVIFRLGTIAGQTKRQCPIITFPGHSCKTRPDLSSSRTATRLYINDLCATAIEKVTNLQGFISLDEINVFMLLRNTNFISVRNSYISSLRIYISISNIFNLPKICSELSATGQRFKARGIFIAMVRILHSLVV